VSAAPAAAPVVAPAAPAPGTPEHDALMAAKFDAANAAQAAAAAPQERPEWLPQQFADGAALAKSYQDAVVEMNRVKQELAKHTKPAAPAAPAAAPADGTPATPAKFDWASIKTAVAEGTALTDAQYAAAEAAGIPRAELTVYVEGQKALEAIYVKDIYDSVGGEENFEAIRTWAKANLSDTERTSLDRMAADGTAEEFKLALHGVRSRMQASGATHSFLDGTAQGGPAGDKYESWAQVSADMRKPEYHKDPAFRAKVEAKVGRSTLP